ncbi:Hypothetical predicted protein [Paramuricea clavata]|uniref:Uncharacterized protein n=1 Tax=Paramuricea clavata TaxID=317549 RepID=A0A7D9DHM4_PARCT|nr:Hypothetical predicted protein [Paramuricea clavata]
MSTERPLDTVGKLEAIESMVTYRRAECLGHPVVLTFLNQKLNANSVRLWIMGNMLLYIIFLVSLTAYTGLQTIGSYNLKSPGMYAMSFITLAFGTINIIKEILQIKLNGKEYFLHFDNYMEWTTYLCAIAYVIQSGQQKDSFQIASGAIAVFFSWINFIWFMKSFSLFGIYVIMAKKVFLSICKVSRKTI